MTAPETDVAPAHPGADFDGCEEASTLAIERARFGLPTRPAGTPNRVRFVALAGGEGWMVVDEPQARLDREALGRRVREVWIEWAREQPSPKPSWLVPWEGLSEADREVDRRIGETIARETIERGGR